ncbi:ribosomal protein S10 [Cladophialophora bantiana CBS 173.52]|uniref:Small ribosomal subunit protein uS10m n=1 Tax=Cladophialophora bantiana (strain ATCC 10958 / CBS 173.52 / CDC B-1940 / NIH 8579) TaxID=1442370 RepID=A0A0D2GJC6_CLAB1|nr:ribosomal protein S10 [Cladophialophora bantiana CBS 173.52]KIW98477.1 ribosomal protein S10 [Cladophialophora bantiana CBS 173.52]
MSAPRCLRIAIEACRPQKTTSVPLRPRLAAQSHPQRSIRAFCSDAPRYEKGGRDKSLETGPVDITAGFPTPEIESYKIQEAYEEEGSPLKKNDGGDHSAAPSSTSKHAVSAIERSKEQPDTVSEIRAQKLQQMPSSTPEPTRSSSVVDDAASSSKAQEKGQPQPPTRSTSKATTTSPSTPLHASSGQFTPASADEKARPNVPPNVLAAYRTPLYHPITHGIPVCQLQLRSFSVRNLEFFADFCVRAAYYLSLPCRGPTPLPKKIERWTVLKSNFVNKKAQENFERITMKRLITVYDGHPDTVETWLAFVRRWQFYGVGMKANLWGWEGIDVASKMDHDFASLEKELDNKLRLFGFNKTAGKKNDLLSLLERQGPRREGVGMSELREKSRTTEDPW